MTRKLGVPLVAGLLMAAASGAAMAADDVQSVAGPGSIVSGLTDGDIATDGGARSVASAPTLASESHLIVTSPAEFSAQSFAVAFLSSAPTLDSVVEPPPVREFLIDPLLADSSFSRSEMLAGPDDFTAFSESWKGALSGDAETVSSAESLTSHTLGASSLKADGVTNQSFTQALSAPEGVDPVFSSAAVESADGKSTYAASAVGHHQGLFDTTEDGTDNPASPFQSSTAASIGMFEGNGIAHVDALAGHVYAESEIIDAFDGETLTGVADVLSSVISPTASVDTAVHVSGDGSGVVNRSVLVSADLASASDIAGGPINGQAVASNEVVFNQTLADNTIVEVGPTRSVSISNAGQNTTGLINVNQDVGNSNNQANIRSIAITDQPNTVLVNDVTGKVSTTGNTLTTNGSSRSDVINDGSFANSSGLLGINQSSGSLNQLTNVLALAVGIGESAVSLGDVGLQSEHSDNTLNEDPLAQGPREDRIDGGAFAGFSGIAQVNQVAGDLNQVTSVVSVSVSVQ